MLVENELLGSLELWGPVIEMNSVAPWPEFALQLPELKTVSQFGVLLRTWKAPIWPPCGPEL